MQNGHFFDMLWLFRSTVNNCLMKTKHCCFLKSSISYKEQMHIWRSTETLMDAGAKHQKKFRGPVAETPRRLGECHVMSFHWDERAVRTLTRNIGEKEKNVIKSNMNLKVFQSLKIFVIRMDFFYIVSIFFQYQCANIFL